MKKPKRSEKIVQIVTSLVRLGELKVGNLVVLTSEGRVLEYAPKTEQKWRQFPALPPLHEKLLPPDAL